MTNNNSLAAYIVEHQGRNSVHRVQSAIVLLEDFAARRVQCISWFSQNICLGNRTFLK